MVRALAALGRSEDALTASEEATDFNRTLAAPRPNAHSPGAAMSLNNLTLPLADLGRAEDALTVNTHRCQAAPSSTAPIACLRPV